MNSRFSSFVICAKTERGKDSAPESNETCVLMMLSVSKLTKIGFTLRLDTVHNEQINIVLGHAR